MSEVAKAARPHRRLAWISAAAVALAVVIAAGWYGWLWYTTPAPPDAPLDGAEPAVVQAVEAARKQVRQNGRSAAAWGQLGKVLRAHAYLKESDACFVQAERFDPREPRWPYYQGLTLAMTNPAAALPLLRRSAERADRYDRGNDGPRLRLAETLLQAGMTDEALAELNRVLSWDSANPRVHYDLGVLAAARDDDEAEERHFTASAVSPYARRKSCSALAAIRLRRQDETGAAKYNHMAAAAPEDWPWDDAYIEECMRLQVGRISRFETTERLEAEGRTEQALPILRSLAEDATDARAQIATGMALYKLGRNEEAERYFRAAVGLKEEQAEANYWLAVVLYTEGTWAKYGEALACADKALALKPDHALAHFYKGLALNGLGRRKEAITAFRQAVLCHPELVDPHWELANALAEEGREDDAKSEWRRVAELAPDADPRRGQALARIGAP